MDSLSLQDSLPDIKPDLSLDLSLDSASLTLQDPQGLPTPPFSPRQPAHQLIVPNNDVIAIANGLIAHYQKESIWVHHTRASLELALTAQGCDSFTRVKQSSASPAIKTEDDSDDSTAAAKPPQRAHPQRRNSRWMQRKQSFNLNLKLDGEPHPAAAALAKRRRRATQQAARSAPQPEASTRLLELFSELVEARMESCMRVSQLARDACTSPMDEVCL